MSGRIAYIKPHDHDSCAPSFCGEGVGGIANLVRIVHSREGKRVNGRGSGCYSFYHDRIGGRI